MKRRHPDDGAVSGAPTAPFLAAAVEPTTTGSSSSSSASDLIDATAAPLAKRAIPEARTGTGVESGEAPSSALVQFQSMTGDALLGPKLDVPLDVTPAQLETLVNQLLSEGDEPVPYTFYLNDVEVLGSLSEALSTQALSTEVTHVLRYQPLAVFRVKPVSRCTDSLPGHTEPILHISFSPDGTSLASGGGDATVQFWDVQTCTPRFTCAGHRHHVLCTAWSPDGRRFASADKSGEVRVWDPATGKDACKPLTGHAAWVTSLAWEPLHRCAPGDAIGGAAAAGSSSSSSSSSSAPRCALLASASKDKTVRVWNTRTGALAFTLSGHTDSVEAVRWGGEGLLYSASRDREIHVWALEPDRSRAKLVRTLSGHGHRINALALNTDGLCRTGPFDHRGAVHATDQAAFDAACKRYATGLAAMGGREMLVSCSDDFTLCLWNPADGKKPVARMTGHQAVVNHLSFSPDGRYIASASFDKKVKVWDGRTGKFLVSYVGHVGAVYQVCWSSDARYLASASKDSTVKIWRVRFGGSEGAAAKPVAVSTCAGHADEVYALDWSPDGAMVASGGRDRLVKM